MVEVVVLLDQSKVEVGVVLLDQSKVKVVLLDQSRSST